MSYIFFICLLTSHILFSLYTERSETSFPCLPVHLPLTASNWTKKQQDSEFWLWSLFFIKTVGSHSSKLITWKGWVRKFKKMCPTWIPRESIENIEISEKQQCCIMRPNKVGIEFNTPHHICVCACFVCVMGGVCHWLVWFSSNVVTRAGHLVGVQSKCHRDQCWAVGVAFHIRLWHFIDVECLKWILTAMTPTK